jgi:putative membrane protein
MRSHQRLANDQPPKLIGETAAARARCRFMKRLLIRWAILALGVVIAAHVVPGVSYRGIETLVVVVLLVSLFNTVIRPILVFFTAPFILLTLGLGLIVINALGFYIISRYVKGFELENFVAAIGAAVVVGLTNWILGKLFLPDPKKDRERAKEKTARTDRRQGAIDV